MTNPTIAKKAMSITGYRSCVEDELRESAGAHSQLQHVAATNATLQFAAEVLRRREDVQLGILAHRAFSSGVRFIVSSSTSAFCSAYQVRRVRAPTTGSRDDELQLQDADSTLERPHRLVRRAHGFEVPPVVVGDRG